jgi:hypothetical protein
MTDDKLKKHRPQRCHGRSWLRRALPHPRTAATALKGSGSASIRGGQGWSCARDDARQIAKFVGGPVAHNRPSRCRCFVGGSRVRSVWSSWSFVSLRSPSARLFPQSG